MSEKTKMNHDTTPNTQLSVDVALLEKLSKDVVAGGLQIDGLTAEGRSHLAAFLNSQAMVMRADAASPVAHDGFLSQIKLN